MRVGISTLAFGGLSREEIVTQAETNGWLIEFSSSFPYQEDMVTYFKSLTIERLAHNYFPAPMEAFVINLASVDENIRERSVQHCLQGLELTSGCGAKYFSAHAGFCIDPAPKQLGRQLDVNVSIDRDENWELFLGSLHRILAEAEKYDISFLIENNVTSKRNRRHDGQEVLLCSTPQELNRLSETIDNPRFGLLLDTAHLKVSSESLSFNKLSAVEAIREKIKYVHHSDNDGFEDTNGSIDANYWFLPMMPEFAEVTHILEVKNLTTRQINEQLMLLKEYGKR